MVSHSHTAHIFLSLSIFFTLTTYCSSSGFNGGTKVEKDQNSDERNLSAAAGKNDNAADGADGSDPGKAGNEFDDKLPGGGKNNGNRDGGNGKDDGDDTATSGDFDDLGGALSGCKSFNGKKKVLLLLPGGPEVDVDLRDYDEGGQVRDNQETGGKTYVFHMKYYRLKTKSGDKPAYARDVHDPAYDEVMYRGLIDVTDGAGLVASDDCKARAFELTDSALKNRLEARDNFNGGCFDPDTKIRLADGTDKRIGDFTGAELVFNPITGKNLSVTKIIKGPEYKPLIAVKHLGKTVHVTSEHAFLTDKGLAQAWQLSAQSKLVGPDGKFATVDSIKHLPILAGQYVYNLVVDGGRTTEGHMVLADGVVTGDLHLQTSLKGKVLALDPIKAGQSK